MRVRLVEEEAAWLGLREVWNTLLTECRISNIFLTFEWLHTWWQHFGRGKRLFLLAAEHDHRLVGLAPLVISRRPWGPRVLEPMGAGVADYHDLIALPGLAEEAIAAFWAELSSHSRRWDLLHLPQICGSAATAGALGQAIGDDGYHLHQSAGDVCPVLDLPATWEEYLSSLSRKTRMNVRRYARLLEKEFDTSYTVVAKPEEVGPALNALFSLHGKRWRRQGLPGVLVSKRRRRFHRELALALLERGWLRLHCLHLGDRPSAALLTYCHGNRHFYYIGGFDPDLDRYSVGTVLLSQCIRSAIEEEAHQFDFLRGAERYKYRMGARDVSYLTLRVTQPKARSRAALAGFSLGDRVIGAGKRWVQARQASG